jgi:steroid Delta-isomerase
MPTAEHIQSVFERYTAAIGAHDYDTAISFYAPDAVVRDPVDGPPIEGTAAIRAMFAESSDAVRGVRLTGPVRIAGDGLHAAAPIEADVDFGDGAKIMAVIDTMVFDDDGRIVEMAAYWGPASLRDA